MRHFSKVLAEKRSFKFNYIHSSSNQPIWILFWPIYVDNMVKPVQREQESLFL